MTACHYVTESSLLQRNTSVSLRVCCILFPVSQCTTSRVMGLCFRMWCLIPHRHLKDTAAEQAGGWRWTSCDSSAAERDSAADSISEKWWSSWLRSDRRAPPPSEDSTLGRGTWDGHHHATRNEHPNQSLHWLPVQFYLLLKSDWCMFRSS